MKLEFNIPSMVCEVCAEMITKAIQTVDESAAVTANPKTKQVFVNTSATEAAVKSAVEQAGHIVS